MLYKSNGNSVLDVDLKSRTVKARIIAFNNVDSDGDIIRPEAVSKTIAERGPAGTNEVFHLLQHDTWKPLGKPKSIEVNNEGMEFVTVITPTSYGTDTLKLYADGVYDNHSVGFNTINSHYETVDEKEVNVITELKLWEGSTVTWGANNQTPFLGFKNKKQLTERINRLIKSIKDGNYTDETFKLLTIELEQLESLIKGNEPGNTTRHKQDEPKNEVADFYNLLKL